MQEVHSLNLAPGRFNLNIQSSGSTLLIATVGGVQCARSVRLAVDLGNSIVRAPCVRVGGSVGVRGLGLMAG